MINDSDVQQPTLQRNYSKCEERDFTDQELNKPKSEWCYHNQIISNQDAF